MAQAAIDHRRATAERNLEAILDATERLLVRAPVRVANMAEVADEAGLAKGTVYLYFASKDELLLAAEDLRIRVPAVGERVLHRV